MGIEGQLEFDLTRNDHAVCDVAIRSTRPLQAVRVFEGMSPQEVLRQLPLLFSVCGIAQAQASQRALDRAQAQTGDPALEQARDLLVLLETAREHSWRILVDWPDFLDEGPLVKLAAPLTTLLPKCRTALFTDAIAFGEGARLHIVESAMLELREGLDAMLEQMVFGCPANEWLQMHNVDELAEWIKGTDTIAAGLLRMMQNEGWELLGNTHPLFLPDITDDQFDLRLSAADAQAFIAMPDWNGKAYETTPLARQYEHPLVESIIRHHGAGLMVRSVALLIELATIPKRLHELLDELLSTGPNIAVIKDTAANGTGIGQVEAARGRLVHRVELDDGRVNRYQILAPTEWNFHPEGVAARGLHTLTSTDDAELKRQAALLISAVDPCVGYELRVR